jgi:5'-3' exonuclease
MNGNIDIMNIIFSQLNICHNYFEGLLWVSRYYFESCPDWRWQYKFTFAPFLSDMMLHIKNKNIMKNFNTFGTDSLNIYTQLVSVIPSTYSNILPKQLQFLNSSPGSPIIDMFPVHYEIDMINKTQLYKCIPRIPYLDVRRVENNVNIYLNQLSDHDKKKSMKAEPFNLGCCRSNPTFNSIPSLLAEYHPSDKKIDNTIRRLAKSRPRN